MDACSKGVRLATKVQPGRLDLLLFTEEEIVPDSVSQPVVSEIVRPIVSRPDLFCHVQFMKLLPAETQVFLVAPGDSRKPESATGEWPAQGVNRQRRVA